jgi:hypothetical protein
MGVDKANDTIGTPSRRRPAHACRSLSHTHTTAFGAVATGTARAPAFDSQKRGPGAQTCALRSLPDRRALEIVTRFG